MAEDDLQASISLELDKASFAKSKRELLKAASEFEAAGKGNRDVFLSQNKELIKQIDIQQKNIKAQEKSLKVSKDQIKAEKSRIELLDEQSSKLRTDVGGLGDVGSAGRTITGLGGALGANVGGLNVATELFDTVEAIGQLKGALPFAAEGFKKVASELGLSSGGLATGLGVAAIAFAGLSIAVTEFNRIAGEANKQIEGTINARADLNDLITAGATSSEVFAEASKRLKQATSDVDQIAQIDEAINKVRNNNTLEGGIAELVAQFGGSIDLLEKEKDRLELRLNESVTFKKEVDKAIANGTLSQNDAARAAIAYSDALGKQSALELQVASFTKTATLESFDERKKALEAEKEALDGQLETLRPFINSSQDAKKQFEILTGRFNDLTAETDLLNSSARQAIQVREDQKALEKSLEEQAKKAAEIDKQKQATLQKLNDLQGKANETLAEFNDQLAKTKEDRSLRDSRELEDFQKQQAQNLVKHQSDLAKIQQDSNDKIADIQANAVQDQTDYFDEEIQATTSYRDDLKKLNRDYNKEQKRDLEDHLKTLRGAARDNNVIAFLEEQDKFKTEQSRKQEDKNASVQELEQQFQVERDLRRKEFEAKQVDIQAEIALVRQQTQQKLAESASAFQQESAQAEQERQLKLQRQAQDDSIADRRAREVLQKRLNDINTEAQAQITAINKVAQATQNLVAVANRIAQTTGNASSSSSSYKGGSQIGSKSYEQASKGASAYSTGTGAIKVTAYANEGVVQKPTFAMLGDGLKSGEAEGVVKFKMSEGLPNAVMRRSGGGQQNITIAPVYNNTIGDIASMAMVTQAMSENNVQLGIDIADGLRIAINNPQIGA